MIQQESAGNAMTGRPYPVPDIRAKNRLRSPIGADQPGFLSSRPVLTAAVNLRHVD
jgi:hypothetical protein